MAEDIFKHYNGVVHHHTYSKGKTRQTDNIDIPPEKGHNQKRTYHTNRYRNGYDDGTGKIS